MVNFNSGIIAINPAGPGSIPDIPEILPLVVLQELMMPSTCSLLGFLFFK